MLGHTHGDLVLHAASKTIAATISNYLARTGDNEFAIVISDKDISLTSERVCARLLSTFDETDAVEVAGRAHRLRLSLGFASVQDCEATAEELLGNAHLALYRAKMSRTASVQFSSDMRDELERRASLEADLSRAVLSNKFELYYQPQLCLGSGAIIGAEALIRWNHPTRGLVSPGEFIPVVNASPLSSYVANWVLRTAIKQASAWQKAGHRIRVGINLSPCQLQTDDLPLIVKAQLETTGLSPDLIELEVTEDILLDDASRALQIFRAVQALGVRLVFDDFGTGYAGLSYLKTFPLNGLKIDQTFVRNLTTDANDAAIVESTIRLSQRLGLTVIAEGIENPATRDLLVKMGCCEGQGYFFGKPAPASNFSELYLLSSEGEAAA